MDDPVVLDGAVAKIDHVAFAGLPDFMGQGEVVAFAGVQVGFRGWKWKSLHGGFLSGLRDGSEQEQKGQQGPKSNARKGNYCKWLESPQKGFSVFSALVISTVVFCYHFYSELVEKFPPLTCVC